MDFEKICRCCLSEKRETKNINSFIEIDNKQEIISDIFLNCLNMEQRNLCYYSNRGCNSTVPQAERSFSSEVELPSCYSFRSDTKFYKRKDRHKVVKPNDGFPQNICVFCVTTLQMTFSFKKVIENSKVTLLQYLEVNDDSMESYMDTNTNIDFLCDTSEIDNLKNDCQQTELFGSHFVESEKQESFIDEEKSKESYVPTTHIYTPPRDKKKSSHLKHSEKYYYCTICSLKFLDPRKLYKHCCTTHKNLQSSGRPCDYCNERFPDFKTLLQHRRKHLTPFVCSLCWKGYFKLSDLNEHLKSCKPKGEDEERSTESTMPKRIMCHVCGKSYPTTYIKIHMLIHTEGNLQCKYCEKKFKQPCSLNSHIMWNHKREKVHQCEFCELVFITSSAKSTHVRKIHKKEKKHSCNSCGKLFFCSSEMKRHTLVHTGVKNYMCAHCDKAYQTRYGLNVHLKSHNI